MLTDEHHADRLLARLNVDDHVRSRVTDDGQVTYSVRSAQRVRVTPETEIDDDLGYTQTEGFEPPEAAPRQKTSRS
jgi:hypothetical protein